MKHIVGVFTSRAPARRAASQLQSIGITSDRINLLHPGASQQELDAVATLEAEQPGMGGAMGGVIGGALGAAAGMPLGAAAASLFVPGVGPVVAVGLVASGLLGAAAGAVGGSAAGAALENAAIQELPIDELYVYEDALRKGRTVLIVLAEEADQADAVRKILIQAEAESLDAAREDWWIGLRDVEEEQYSAIGQDFKKIEYRYRQGFQAALNIETRGQTYEEVREILKRKYPDVYAEESFRHGYERGRAHYQTLREKYKADARLHRATGAEP